MKNINYKLGLMIASAIGLSACGGGGGGSGVTAGTSNAIFTKWSSVQPSTTISVSGDSQQGTYTWNSGTNKVTAVTNTAQQSGATLTESFNSSGLAQTVRFQTASGTDITFTRGTDTFGVLIMNSNINAVVSADGTKYALTTNPTAFGWDYQSFGIWTTGAGTGSGTYGAASVGVATPASSIPTTGTATFSGYTGGRYVATDGSYYYTSSAMTAATDFAARSISFATTGTSQTADLLSSTTNSNLNMTGTLTYASGSNQFTGAVTTTSGLTGTATGRFYGPTATEIGGTFGVTGTGVTSYGGAFGGKR
jgi:C-lobe and N-lobe beta barrels of Tf-binding protein B